MLLSFHKRRQEMSHMSPEDVLIRMWPTPNPSAVKFTLNIPLKEEGKATFHSQKECEDLPLVYSLFLIPGVKRVYLFQNQMTLTHENAISKEELNEQVSSVIKTRILSHNPRFQQKSQEPQKKVSRSNDPFIQKIEEILDRTIRPGLQSDGGDLEVVSAQNDEIRIAYQGACGGCPSAMTGTLDAIENILKHELSNPNITVTPV